jgi:hypothetical protein
MHGAVGSPAGRGASPARTAGPPEGTRTTGTLPMAGVASQPRTGRDDGLSIQPKSFDIFAFSLPKAYVTQQDDRVNLFAIPLRRKGRVPTTRGGQVAYAGDRDMWCGKEKKKTRHTGCPQCNGKGDTLTTQCGWRCQKRILVFQSARRPLAQVTDPLLDVAINGDVVSHLGPIVIRQSLYGQGISRCSETASSSSVVRCGLWSNCFVSA